MKKIAILLAFSLIFISACSDSQSNTTSTTASETNTTTAPREPKEGLEIGDIAPDITLTALDGTKYKLSDFRGQVVLLNFWATWCGYCREEMPMMQEMHEKYGDQGLAILAVDIGEDKPEIESFMQELGFTFPAFLDKSKDIYRAYNKSNGVPQTYIIDRNGIIQGYVPGSFASLVQAAQVKGLLMELLGIKND